MILPKRIRTEKAFYKYLKSLDDNKLIMNILHEMGHTGLNSFSCRLDSLMNELEKRLKQITN